MARGWILMDLSTAAVAAASEVPPDLGGEEVEVDGASISMVVCFKSYGSFTFLVFASTTYPRLFVLSSYACKHPSRSSWRLKKKGE